MLLHDEVWLPAHRGTMSRLLRYHHAFLSTSGNLKLQPYQFNNTNYRGEKWPCEEWIEKGSKSGGRGGVRFLIPAGPGVSAIP